MIAEGTVVCKGDVASCGGEGPRAPPPGGAIRGIPPRLRGWLLPLLATLGLIFPPFRPREVGFREAGHLSYPLSFRGGKLGETLHAILPLTSVIESSRVVR